MKHRREEDDLYRKFAKQREEQDKRIKEEIRVRTRMDLAFMRIPLSDSNISFFETRLLNIEIFMRKPVYAAGVRRTRNLIIIFRQTKFSP